MVLKKVIRPALVRAKITGKVIGWHCFRHSLATNLRAAGADLKTAQELLRHANSRITLDVYPRQHPRGRKCFLKRAAKRVPETLSTLQHPRGVKLRLSLCHKPFHFLGLWRGRRGSNPRPLP
jgi:hypothetical protein